MAGEKPKVVVVGGSYIDLALRCGEVPQAGICVSGSELCYSTSGPGPNQAVQAVNCGCEVHLLSKLGGDPFGPLVRQTLEQYGVNTDCVYMAEAMNTGVYVTLVNAAGENAGCHFAGANSALQARDIEAAEEIIADAAVCLIHGQLPQEAIVAVLRCAEVHGTTVILNPVRPLAAASGDVEETPLEYFGADIVIPNLYEAADIADQALTSIRTAKMLGSDLVARGVKTAVITMGRRGCMLVDRNGADHVPAFEVESVDHTCRGDAFAGALAAYCAVGGTMREAVEFAAAAGALACTRFGSIEALPSKADIIELLQKESL